MKILMINDFKEKVGGIEISIYELKSMLEKRGHIVDLFTGDLEYKNSNNKKSVSKMINLIFDIKYYFKFRKALQKFNPDIIHIHSFFNELSPSFLFGLNNYPVVMTVHDNRLFSPVSRQAKRSGKNCENEICRGCRNCVGIKGSLYEMVKRTMQKKLFKNINLYIGNSNYITDIINRLKIGEARKINFYAKLQKYTRIINSEHLLYVGRLSEEKGIEYVIKALPEITKTFSKIKFTIIGDGAYKNYLQKLAKDIKVSHHIQFLGQITPNELQKHYENSSVVLVPSIWEEPFGMVGIEAMSAGRPVIASRVGGVPEWLEDGKTGYLVKPANEKEIAEKIKILLSDKKLQIQMGENARRKAEEFSLEQHVNKLENIYRKLYYIS